uniref:Zinc finger PHD-type domain-containing protein n=1 Tax=Oryza punctata TaxID=4537 RepID=A0A0E0MCR7_ORYPU
MGRKEDRRRDIVDRDLRGNLRRRWIPRSILIAMNVLCEVCGDVGWEELILRCNKCKNAARHQYCFDPVIYDGSLVEWSCNDCLPNGNEVGNLLDISNQRKSSQTELGFSITKETNMKKMKLTKGLWSWGHHRNRSFKARCDGSDSRTKHFASGNAFSSSEMFTGEMSKINDCEMEGIGKNEYSSHSALDNASRAEQHINIQNPMGSLKPTLNSIKGLNLSSEKDGRFSSSDHVEGSIPEGRDGLFSSVNDVERAHLMIRDGSNPTFTSVEHMDLVHKKQLLQPSSLERNSMGTSIPCSENMDVLHKMQLLKPSTLEKKYVDKSVPNSEKMDVMLMERSCPLNNPMGIRAKRVVTNVDPIEPSRQFDQACLEVSSKAHEIHEADAGSKGAQNFKNGKPKKQRRLILPYEEEEDVEPIQVDDVNCQSCGIDGQTKKPVEIVAALGDINAGCGQNVCSQLALPTIAVKGQCGLSSTPFITKYFCVQPIDEPNWTYVSFPSFRSEDLYNVFLCGANILVLYVDSGIMKIGMDYIPVGAHLSNKACKKVCELSMSLPQIMKVTEIPISKAWPKSWEEASVPTAESIGLFFFSQNTRSNKEFDDLVKHVIDCDIVLETDVSFAKLLVFPSVVLPAEYRVFQGKHYLWGVFKRSKDMAERDALVEQNCTGCLADEDVPEQNALDIVPSEALDQEMALVVSDIHHHNQLSLTASQEVEKEALSDKGPSPPVINSPEKPMYLILDTSCKVLKKWRCKRMRTKSSVL